MAHICKVEKCSNPVFGKGYCKFHQYKRKDSPISKIIDIHNHQYLEDEFKEELGQRSPKPKKQSKSIKQVSVKRASQLSVYHDIKAEMIRDAKLSSNYRCFCCKDSLVNPDIHHLNGREESKLTDKFYLILVCRNCHRALHDCTIEQLHKLVWYKWYLISLSMAYPDIYQKELRRIDKSNYNVPEM